jgi:hypothetical protein
MLHIAEKLDLTPQMPPVTVVAHTDQAMGMRRQQLLTTTWSSP